MRRLKARLSRKREPKPASTNNISRCSDSPSSAEPAAEVKAKPLTPLTQPPTGSTRTQNLASGSSNVNRIGITIVHEPAGAAEIDIVLVHGLFGNPKRTWTAKDVRRLKQSPQIEDSDSDDSESASHDARGEVFWPRDLLPQVMPNARIMTWGYDVQIDSLLRATSTASVFHHAEMLLSDLETTRRGDGEAERPIIFIAHSLGGIVVKDAIGISQSGGLVNQTILSATKGVLFLGTPHKGSQMATVARAVFGISRLFLRDSNTKILRVLETQSEVLERISWAFGQVLASGRIRVHSFREELSTGGIEIVKAHSATIGYFHETRGHLYATHRNMAKFHSLDDLNFQRVGAVLRRWLAEIRGQGVPHHDVNTGAGGRIQDEVSDRNTNFPDGLIFDEAYQSCLASLNTTEVRQRFEDIQQPFEDTYGWLFEETPGFTSWLRGHVDHPIFWVQGKPGSGKSTVMKYAAKSAVTMSHLRGFRDGDWKIITFFFHDRGSIVQKSVDGLAREMLFQFLSQEKSIFQDLFHFLTEKGVLDSGASSPGTPVWTPQLIKETIEAIGEKVNSNLNFCVFLDALDEHHGDHQGLLRMITSLRSLATNPSIRLRICLASRPENLFKQEFAGCTTLVIHHHTVNDIRTYTESRIGTAATRGGLSAAGKTSLRQLSAKVIARAQGVFLWVKLVVDELVEGLQEGDSIEELTETLKTIPSELSDLYKRALLRTSRASSRALARAQEEGFYIFRIAAAWQQPFTIYTLFGASLFLATRRPLSVDFRAMTLQQLHHRLYSRSSGLLEAPEAYNGVNHGRTVQFIHQSAKEYMVDGEGANVLRERVPEGRLESGSMLIFRYLAHLIASLGTVNTLESLDSYLVYRDFVYFASRLEAEEKCAVVPMVEQAVLGLREDAQERLLSGLWEEQQQRSPLRFTLHSWKDARNGTFLGNWARSKAMMLLFSIYSSLPLSIAHYLPGSDVSSISEVDSLGLLQIAAWNSKSCDIAIAALLQAGLRKNLSDTAWERHFLAYLEDHVAAGLLLPGETDCDTANRMASLAVREIPTP